MLLLLLLAFMFCAIVYNQRRVAGCGGFARLSVCSCKGLKKERKKEEKKELFLFFNDCDGRTGNENRTLPVSFTRFDHYLDAASSVGQHRQQEKAREAISTTNNYFWLFDDFRSEATSKHVKDSKERYLL